MKKSNFIKIGMIILTVLSAACGRGGAVAGHTYVATQQGYGGMQTGYNYGYPQQQYGYNQPYGYNSYGYNGYNTGYGMQSGAGDSIAFDNNMRATYRQTASNATMTGTYSYTDSSNQQLQFIPDANQTQTMNTMMTGGTIRFMVSSDGSYITNQNTGAVMYRQ